VAPLELAWASKTHPRVIQPSDTGLLALMQYSPTANQPRATAGAQNNMQKFGEPHVIQELLGNHSCPNNLNFSYSSKLIPKHALNVSWSPEVIRKLPCLKTCFNPI